MNPIVIALAALAFFVIADGKKSLDASTCVPLAAAELIGMLQGKGDNQLLALADMFQLIGFAEAARCLRERVVGVPNPLGLPGVAPPPTAAEIAACDAAMTEAMAADINNSHPDVLDGYALVMQAQAPAAAACLRAVAKAKRRS